MGKNKKRYVIICKQTGLFVHIDKKKANYELSDITKPLTKKKAIIMLETIRDCGIMGIPVAFNTLHLEVVKVKLVLDE